MTVKTLGLFAVAMSLISCTSKRSDGLDPDRVLHMAGEEAGQITNPKARLTRQLNVAYRQIENRRLADARATLGRARATMEAAHDASAHDEPPLSDHDRLAGWISISELAREAGDPPLANAALDRALAHLDRIDPPTARCDYVPGIAREVRQLRGDAAAARLVSRAGEWAARIAEQPTRRAAYVAFAEELFRSNDYEAARQMLRRDEDAAWRSDALTAIADSGRYYGSVLAKSPAGAAMATEVADKTGAAQTRTPFGKAVDFRSTFYQAK
jgi:hypothetical protein